MILKAAFSKTKNQHRAAQGFTLVEVLVALAVLAIALPALMLSISEQLRGLGYLREKSIAHWVAMNKMTELRLQNAHKQYLPKDRKNGSVDMLGREWFWYLSTQKTSEELLLEVTVRVSASRDDDDTALASVVNYFLLPDAASRFNSGGGRTSGESGAAQQLDDDDGGNGLATEVVPGGS